MGTVSKIFNFFDREMLNLILVASVTQAFKHHRNGTDGTECIQGGDDYIIGKLCTEQCVGYLVECVAECNNDPVCISMCAREESKCVDSCPCHTDCMEGCFGCEHPLCNQCDGDIDENEDFHRCEDSLAAELAQCLASCGGSSSCIIGCSTNYENGFKNCPCMEGCPKGCPCPEWDC